VDTPEGALVCDTLCPALGWEVRADLARELCARLAGDTCIEIDDHGSPPARAAPASSGCRQTDT